MIPSLTSKNVSQQDKCLEARAFLSFFNEKVLPARRMGIAFGIFFYGIFGLLDVALLEKKELFIILSIRYLLILPLAFLVLGCSFRVKWVQRHFEPIVAFLIFLCSLSMILMVTLAHDAHGLSHYMFGVLLVIFVGYSLFRLFFFWAGITGALIIIAFLLSTPWLPMEKTLVIAYALQLFCGYVGSMIGAYVMETASYRDYLSNMEMEAQRKKVDGLNADLELRVEERTRIYNEKAREAERLLEQQQLIERTLRMTEKQHRDLLEIVEDACFELDLEGRIQYFNTALCRITGRHPSEIRANRFFCWLNVDDATLLRKQMESKAHVGGTAILSLDLQKPDEDIVSVRLSLSPREDGQSRISGFRCVARDTSREVRLKTELNTARQNQNLSDSHHLKFLRHMTHSLRTPMNAILGGLHLLTEKTEASVTLGEASGRMQGVLEDIQDYIQLAEGQWVSQEDIFSPKEAGSEICASYSVWAENRGLEFHFETRNLPDFLQGDVRFFKRILNKFLDNALRFTEKGSIDVFLGCRNIADMLWLVMEVADTGCGMDEVKIAHAFEAPHSMKGGEENQSTMGLGLAFIHLMTEQLEGNLRIRSLPEKGTRIICEIPVREVRPVEEKNKGQRQFQAEQNKRKQPLILLVEDNIINQKITMKLLEINEYTPDLAENGIEALEKLKKQSYDLILMDVQMPEMDGLTATRKIREGLCGKEAALTPIVAFTAHASPQDRQACLDAGMDDVLTKPARPEALQAMVEKWIRQKEL
ncbi:response regulator [Desulfobotulus mexicanus]|uniref:histidine kinase n=1 Tax=Desulfobotulus mexicanus TaxID=2586642 RepID=A0A5Q4VE59_9BACT|nr:response regulator [Desulfobotulus mexicanus]TYT75216.1 response regulator [Desulfobotulus mexicanus]